MTSEKDNLLGQTLALPVLHTSQTIDAMTDVGPMYLHRDDEVITPTLLSTGCWEPQEAAFLRTVLNPGRGFLDVGANIGYFSLLASAIVGPTGCVFAIEPEPRNLGLLRANIWRNRAWNVRVLPLAAQAKTGYVGLRLSEGNRGDHQVIGASGHVGSLVPAIRLDEALDGSYIDVVKIDTQGVDHEVVEGLTSVIAEKPGIVFLCEFWLTGMEDRDIDPHQVIAQYQELGFQVGLLGAEGSVYSATGDEVIQACRVGDNDFVNLVLTSTNSEVHMIPLSQSKSSETDPPNPTPLGVPTDPKVVDRIQALAEKANRAGGGYHMLRPLPGVVVKGEYDMASILPAYHLPDDLTGKTVLDVGTASGFFAMECARRGAHVTAVDLVLWDTHHWAIAELMQWDVTRVQMDIYDLDSAFGKFDLVICGSLLLHLPDPVGAIRCLHSVCGGRAIVSTSRPEQDVGTPTCEFVGESQENGAYWVYWNISMEALRRMLLAAGFDRVEHQDYFTLKPVPDHPHEWSIYHAVAHGVILPESNPFTSN